MSKYGWVFVAGGIVALIFVLPALAQRGPDRPEKVIDLGALADPDETYDPTEAGEDLPDGYRRSLPRDAILPVYDPKFVSADQSGWSDESLVIGVEIGGEAKAYPVAHLNHREMVIDRLNGTPILVSW